MDAEAVRGRFLDALLAADRRSAFGTVDDARAEGMPVGALYLEVFQPSLREIGRLWEENRITVADEHVATAIAQAAMSRLYDAVFSGGNVPGRLLLAACADTERHEIGLRMVCDLLEMEGWDTVFLGATVPVESLVAMVLERKPQVVALSAAIAPHLGRVAQAIGAIRQALPHGGPLVAVGGRAFLADPGLAERLGADLTANDAAQAARLIQERFA